MIQLLSRGRLSYTFGNNDMFALIIGTGFLIYTLWCTRNEEADPFWFISYLDWIEVSRIGNPFLYWVAIITQLIFSVGLMVYGIMDIL